MVVHVLKLEGRSGCDIQIKSNEKDLYICKTSPNSAYNNRLKLQAHKQSTFILSEPFCIPKIINVGLDNNLTYINMEYVYGDTFSEFLYMATLEDLNKLASTFINYFDIILKACSLEDPKDKVLEKYKQTKIGNTYNGIENIIKNAQGSIPMGQCHGDLTLSNMLFSKNSIYLFDFLDSYINSPLIDIVKIRQDTKFYWSVLISNGSLEEHKFNKIIFSLKYLDLQLIPYFSTHFWYNSWYTALELVNLLRILPYLSKAKELDFVNTHIFAIIKDYEVNNTNSR